ncbi:MAG: redox-regulated ATPase YchF [Desulfatibacillum sp.]|nr:redox-regulated ATPase YchF [Desulfatibacillum sp.]
MQLGIIGLERCGKTTLFEALTQSETDVARKGEVRIGTINVPDERVDILSKMYNPRKTIYAQIQYVLPGARDAQAKSTDAIWNPVRTCDALIHVVRNFQDQGGEDPNPSKDFSRLDQELVFADLVVVEKRLERMELDSKRGKKVDTEEQDLLKACLELLEQEKPIRTNPELAAAPKLRGFTFVSAKPTLIVFNNDESDDAMPQVSGLGESEICMVVRGKLEAELGLMDPEEAQVFLEEYGVKTTARDRMIRKSYELLGQISFFTVGEDEVRAWTITRATQAVDAADVIHSDIKRGFIRAETLGYQDLIDTGSYVEAKKAAKVRLEGKTYIVADGDIINFRFNV